MSIVCFLSCADSFSNHREFISYSPENGKRYSIKILSSLSSQRDHTWNLFVQMQNRTSFCSSMLQIKKYITVSQSIVQEKLPVTLKRSWKIARQPHATMWEKSPTLNWCQHFHIMFYFFSRENVTVLGTVQMSCVKQISKCLEENSNQFQQWIYNAFSKGAHFCIFCAYICTCACTQTCIYIHFYGEWLNHLIPLGKIWIWKNN